MTHSAIILAGGFGKRLQSVVKDVPKPMADIAGKPFLEYLLRYLRQQGIQKSILCVGYKWEIIKNYFGDVHGEMKLEYSVEEEPLGTGGAILKAVLSAGDDEFFIVNGDTFFNIDLHKFHSQHKDANSKLSLALKPMENFDRYGVVKTDSRHRIISFEEKKVYQTGNINGGIYLLSRLLFSGMSLPQKFSFENDVMEKYYHEIPFSGFSFEDYFIDIGIPEDYARAQKELPALLNTNHDARSTNHDDGDRKAEKHPPFTTHYSPLTIHHSPFTIDPSWTLFLDRDGVINKKIDDDYVRSVSQFEWLPGVPDALKKLPAVFGKIIIVSNQQGVGKGLMRKEDVEAIHHHIIDSIKKSGGRIDRIYYAPQLKAENSEFRKPNIGMALQAKKDFPEIDFSRSIMVGDSVSDMEFGKKAGMKTVYILNGKQLPEKSDLVDVACESLRTFADFF